MLFALNFSIYLLADMEAISCVCFYVAISKLSDVAHRMRCAGIVLYFILAIYIYWLYIYCLYIYTRYIYTGYIYTSYIYTGYKYTGYTIIQCLVVSAGRRGENMLKSVSTIYLLVMTHLGWIERPSGNHCGLTPTMQVAGA